MPRGKRHAFYADDARARAVEAVRAIEGQTSAEVVISLRPESDAYVAASYLAGAILGLISLVLLLFLPQEFPLYAFPIDVALAFGIGSFIGRRSSALRRWLTPRQALALATRRAARAAFVDLGISRTSGRTGLLVYASMLEAKVELVADIGLDPTILGRSLSDASAALSRALARRDLDGFLSTLTALGPALGAALPRAEDDVNELPDGVELGEAP